ncbi:MAG: hypothetical protein ACHQCF_05095 [Solirubrobacterales bacterium]
MVNLTAIVLAGVATLYVQRRAYERQRRRHLEDDARLAIGLPTAQGRRTPA